MPEVLVKQSPLYNVHASVTISPGMTVAEIVEQCRFPEPVKPLVAVFIEDIEVPRDQWAHIKPKPTTLLYVSIMPAGGGGNGGKNPLVAIASLAIAVAAMAFGGPLGTALFNSVGASALGTVAIGSTTLAVIAGSAVISLTGMLLLSALVKPPNSADGQSAPRFSIMGSSNRANPYGLIPRVFGKTKVYPQLAAQPYTETVGDDQYLRMLLLVGHGPLKISDIRIGETPLASFQNVESQISEGGPVGWAGSTSITLYTNAVNQEDMSVLLEPDVYAIRTTSVEAAEVSVDVVFPGGLFSTDNKGRRQQRSIVFEAAWRVPGASWSNIEQTDQRTTLSNAQWETTLGGFLAVVGYDDLGNEIYGSSGTLIPGRFRVYGSSSSAIRCGFRIKFPAGGQYEVRIKRVTGAGGNNDVDLAYLTAVRSVIYRSAINEPGLALIALRIKASKQLNGTPNQINCIVESYLPTWDPSTGWSWAITRNPAWIYTDLLRRRGQATLIDDSRLDLTTLRAWAIACDATAPNANEPRWTFDGVIDGGSVFDGLNRVASHGRASFVIREGKYSAVRDAGTGGIVQHITPRNSWGYQGRKQFIDQPHALRVRFVNAAKGYQEDERLVFDDGYNSQNATRFETVELYGCTSSTMAWREGRYYLAIGQLRPEEHTVSMDVENLRANMGDLVMFAHDVIAVGASQGRILSRVLTGENLLIRSEEFDNAAWVKSNSSVVANAGLAPDGNLTADQITYTLVTTSTGYILQTITVAVSIGTTYTWSCYVKSSLKAIRFGGGTPAGTDVWSAVDVGNGWYRQVITRTFSVANASAGIQAMLYGWDPAGAGPYLIWGAQLEQGTSATEYRPTTTATFPRAIAGFVLDETVVMEAGKQYGMRVRQEDGTAAVLSLATVAGESNTVSLSQAAAIATGPDAGDLFMFGESGREATRMLIKRIEPGPDLTAVITMADAPDGIYTADTTQIPDFNSNITLQRLPEFDRPTTPTFTVRSDESVLLRLADGTLQDRIGIFPAPVQASLIPIDGYETQFKESSTTSWQFGPRSTQEAPVVYIAPVVAGIAYDLRIRAISRAGVPGKWENVAGHVVVGKTTRPSAVLNFTASSLVDGTQLSWDFPALDTDIDVVSFEIRRGDSWDLGTPVTEDFAGTTLFVAFSSGTPTERFWIKATDSIGLQSLTASTVLASAQAPADIPRLDIYPQDDRVRLTWTEVPGSGILYEIREGETWALGRFVVRASGSTTLVQWPLNQEGERSWWIRAYLPTTGLYSVNAQFASVNQAPISNRNVVVDRDFVALGFPGVLHRMLKSGGGLTLRADSVPIASGVYPQYNAGSIEQFSRASTATYYDGFTNAKAEENFVLYSDELENTVWVKTGLVAFSANTDVAPDGTTTAEKIVSTAAAGFHRINQVIQGTTLVAFEKYTVSFYAKAAGRQFARIEFVNGAFASMNFSLTTGAITQSGGAQLVSTSVTDVGNGWYRASITFDVGPYTNFDLGPRINGVLSGTATTFSYTGDGTSGILLWGVQFENRLFASGYLKTQASMITNYIPALQTAAVDVPRVAYDPITGNLQGLLLEDQRTNICAMSEQFDTASWSKTTGTTVFPNACIAPNGTLTADLIYYDGSGTAGNYRIAHGGTLATFGAFTVSIWLRSVSPTTVRLYSNHSIFATCNVTSTWQRFSLTVPSPNPLGFMQLLLYSPVGVNTPFSVFAWGAQIEVGSTVSSYIPTTSAAVTRSADIATIRTANFPRGEFFGEIDLGQDLYARNWIEMRANSLSGGALPWINATFTWADSGGGTWDGALNDATGAELSAKIYPSGYTETGLIEGIPLNGSLAGLVSAAGYGTAAYAEAHYRLGLYLEDDGVVDWSVAIPAQFSCTFDLRLTTLRESLTTFLTLGGSGVRLEFGYDPTGTRFFVQDQAANRINLVVPRSLGDVISFGFNQSGTTRTLMAATRYSPTVVQASASLAPVGALTTVSNYDTQAAVTTWGNAAGDWSAAASTWGSYAGRTGIRATLSDIALWSTQLGTAAFEARLADPRPLGNSPGKPFLPGDYRYETAIVGLRLEDEARTNQTLSVTEAHAFVDVPDVVDRGSVFVPISGVYVPFSRTFLEAPEVQAVQIGGAIRALVTVDTITTAGFFVTLFDPVSPNNQSGTISWSALGR